ncbi:MAG: Hsp70 family protein [Micavibrio aeruginosavorus]|uniref:Hsp70 family protein n=1 Tax=Micavibrio aeruginosavorus TaxID=349221 RepID=A0A2W5FJP5_9BACT|nr:MAG: Hsp70 family protein [Micavibrio aeruginosavorus]
MVDKYFCGIDFGTSNSAMSVGSANGTSLVPLEESHVTIPSAIFFNTEENQTSFGRKGMKEYLVGYEGRLLRSLKSVLGSELISEATQVGRRKLPFRDIIGMFIGHIKKQGEIHVGAEISDVVMGRPVHFVDGDEAADCRAQTELEAIARAQGFKNIHFEYEPLAAARDYESTIGKEEIVLVFDIGGGTSDFSVVRLSPSAKKKADRQKDILANEGIHIGGTNFDQKLSLETVMKDLGYQTKLKSGLDMPRAPYLELSTWHLINFLYTQKAISEMKSLLPLLEERSMIERFIRIQETQRGHEIVGKVEEAKIALSENKKHRIDLSDIEQGWHKEITVQSLHKAIDGEIDRIVAVAKDTVDKAGLKSDQINAIFMTGGSTGLPGFELNIRKAFASSQIQYGDRFSSVAKGLGLAAADQFL